MHFPLKIIKEKYQKLFPSSPKEDRSFEGPATQPEEQAKIDSVSGAYTKWLCDLWHILQKQTYHQIKVDDLEAFGIRHENLELDTGVDGPLQPLNENTFFLPNFEKVKNLQPDPDQWDFEDLMIDLGEWPEPWKSPWKSEFYRAVDRDHASSLCSALDVAFASLKWKEYEKKESICLQDQTDWKPADFSEAFDFDDWRVSGFWLNSKRDSWPENVWLSRNKPHIMATISHDCPHDNGSLLLCEIQAIIELMIVRLVNNSVPQHNIVPVLLYSYTGDKHGRVLQAYMDDKNLVIRTSKFYDFSAKLDAHLKLLLQYMVGDLVGSTMTLTHPQLESINPRVGLFSDLVGSKTTLETPDPKSIDRTEDEDSDSGFGSAGSSGSA